MARLRPGRIRDGCPDDPGRDLICRLKRSPELEIKQHAREIHELLAPFWKRSPELRPALPDLVARAHEAIHWLAPLEDADAEQGVRSRGLPAPAEARFNDPYVQRVHAVRTIPMGPQRDLATIGREFHEMQMSPSFPRGLVSLAAALTPLESALPDWTREIGLAIESLFDVGFTWHSPPTVHAALWWSLYEAVMLTVADMPAEARRLRPLLDLWQAGNFPIGLDAEGRLVLLVA